MLFLGQETALDEDREYVWWPSGGGTCLAEVQRGTDGEVRIATSKNEVLTASQAQGLEPFSLDTLIGQRVLYRVPEKPSEPARVVRVFGTLGGKNQMEIRRDRDGRLRTVYSVRVVCRP